ncbi:hypothetical protein B9J80_10720 [Vibrio sp. V12_P9A6T4]|nr:hypothetical protein B9J80_10720 [Vibrio sp. V12_P9A6T4]
MFTVCFLSSVVRCQPLSRALCFNHLKSAGCIFSLLSLLLNFGLVGKLTLVVAVFWTPIRGR